ncbi:MAG: ribosome small subunit-dependent GTPase [Phycisphaerales bacterium]|nr:ribosome small subunit-dependent GTPase [Phycisphaerales bacterium]
MPGKPKKPPRQKDMTERFRSGDFDEDRVEQGEQFKARNKTLQSDKMAKTAELREGGVADLNIDALPAGEVVQVYSLYTEVLHAGKVYRCTVRRTLTRVSGTFVVVGDLVRFRDTSIYNAAGKDVGATTGSTSPTEGVIEQILPRRTLLTRSDSFKGITSHPIIANAEQVLLVASIRQPYAKWGLIDRMLVAAEAGGLKPIVVLNKVDLATPGPDGSPPADLAEANEVLGHYEAMGVTVVRTSVEQNLGLDTLRGLLHNHVTVLAGHSGVGKSSLVRAVESGLDIRVGEVSRYTAKGRHTTTSARRYPLAAGGAVVDTPGVKQFGLWNVTRASLADYFPDVAAGTAPAWRQQSYERMLETLPPDDPYATRRAAVETVEPPPDDADANPDLPAAEPAPPA